VGPRSGPNALCDLQQAEDRRFVCVDLLLAEECELSAGKHI
jgi:hypothetical protein